MSGRSLPRIVREELVDDSSFPPDATFSGRKAEWPEPIPLVEFLAQPPRPVRWIADGLIPAGGIVIIYGKPKVGKSTLARDLAYCIATGVPFLGRTVKQGRVLYLALEEHADQFRELWRRMQVSHEAAENIIIHPAGAPDDEMAWLGNLIRTGRPTVVVIDTLFRLMRVQDESSYAQLTKATGPLIDIARTTDTALVAVHHMRKAGGQDGDAILGSTAIFGTCDTAIELARQGENDRRTVKTIQRYGDEMPRTELEFDPDTGLFSVGRSVGNVSREALAERIVSVISERGEITRADLNAAVGGDKTLLAPAIDFAVTTGRVTRRGSGKKGDPFKFALS